MQYVILISNPSYRLTNMKDMIGKNMDVYLNEKDGILSVKAKEGDIIIRRADEVLHDFDESEIRILESSIKFPETYLVNYKDVDDVKRVLKLIANRTDIFIDTDTGLFMNGEEFNKISATRPGWNWLNE